MRRVFDAPAERDPAGERRVNERQHDDRRVHSGHLGEDAEGVGVAGALRPFVDRVVGRRGDDDGMKGIRDLGEPGLLYWLRTGLPVRRSMAA